MRKLDLFLVVAMLATLGIIYALPAPCAGFCPTYSCAVSSQCGANCSCLKTGSDTLGTCVSF